MKKLHEKQSKLLKLLEKTIDNPLSLREIQEELDISAPSLVHHHIQQLEKKGYLRRNPSNPRDYQILKVPEREITYLNMYGLAECGPNGSILDGNPIGRVPVISRYLGFPSVEGFIVKAKGDSMEPKIKSGDFVIARKSQIAENNDIVVCVNNGEALIKKILIPDKSKKYILKSLNDNYPPFLSDNQFKIEGIVKGIFTYKLE